MVVAECSHELGLGGLSEFSQSLNEDCAPACVFEDACSGTASIGARVSLLTEEFCVELVRAERCAVDGSKRAIFSQGQVMDVAGETFPPSAVLADQEHGSFAPCYLSNLSEQ